MKRKAVAADNVDKIVLDVPLFMRLIEWGHEDVKHDVEIHKATERLLEIQKSGVEILSMQNYPNIIGASEVNAKLKVKANKLVSSELKKIGRELAASPNQLSNKGFEAFTDVCTTLAGVKLDKLGMSMAAYKYLDALSSAIDNCYIGRWSNQSVAKAKAIMNKDFDTTPWPNSGPYAKTFKELKKKFVGYIKSVDPDRLEDGDMTYYSDAATTIKVGLKLLALSKTNMTKQQVRSALVKLVKTYDSVSRDGLYDTVDAIAPQEYNDDD